MKANPYPHLFQMGKRILALALPMAGSQFINVSSGFLCMAMLAKLGHVVLASSALIFSAQASIMVTGMSILFSLSILIGHAFGAKKYLEIGNFVQQGWILGMLISLPVIFLFWHMKSILILFGQSTMIANIVGQYFHAYVWAVIPGILSTCNQQFGYAIHQKKIIILTSLFSVMLLLISAYIFIFGKYGFPAMGVMGLGYALTLQYTSFFIITMLFFYFDKRFEHFHLFDIQIREHWEQLIQLFKVGWPISIQMGGEMLSFLVTSLMVGWLGTVALSAFQIVNQYYFLIVIPMFALSQASGILIGHAYGAKQFHEITALGYASILVVLGISIMVAIIFMAAPKYLASFYINVNNPINAETLRLVMLLFLIVAFSQLLDGLRNILIGVLRGLLDTKFPMQMGLLTIWVIGIPASYLLAFVLHKGIIGIALGGLLGMLSGASIMFYRWQQLIKKYE